MNVQLRLKNLPSDAYYDEMDSPVGALTIISTKQGLHNVLWDVDRKDSQCHRMMQSLQHCENEKTIIKTKKQLHEYFLGKRKKFDLPLVLNGTDFQIQAWRQLLAIPYAKTISYAQQAEKIGNKNKARAVGMANGQNPISIIVPCHRVIGSNGKLVGFAGGLDKKALLLKLEQSVD